MIILNRGSAHIGHNLKAKIQHVRKPLVQVLSATVEEIVKPTFEFRSKVEQAHDFIFQMRGSSGAFAWRSTKVRS